MYRFGDFRLDPATRELHRGSDRIVLPPKVFECLLWLIEHRERAVGRDELIAAVWGKTDAADNLLAQVIVRLRRLLDDDGGESGIRTVPRFGYRWVAATDWVAPVDADARSTAHTAPQPAATPESGTRVFTRDRLRTLARVGWPLAALLIGAVAWTSLARRPEPVPIAGAAVSHALLLPVVVEAAPGNEWMRLGLMALMIERLRSAGQAVVPGENVVAWVGAHDPASKPHAGTSEHDAWPSAFVIAAHARSTDGRWTVALRTLRGIEPALASVAESGDALDAARQAADRMAEQLGLVPLPIVAADYEPSLTQLLIRIEAATLAGEAAHARALLDAASTAQRDLPELRYQRAWLDFNLGRLVDAQTGFEALLADLSPTDAPLMRARCLNGLANVQYERGDIEGLRRSADAAIALLHDHDAPGETGRALMSRAVANSQHGDDAAAQQDFVQARVALESAGDRLGVARAELAGGILDKRRGRFSEALPALENAATHLAAFDDVHDELLARIHLAEAHLLLLDPAAALAIEPRLRELAARAHAPRARSLADLVRVETLLANGRRQAATALLQQACGEARDGTCASSPWPLQWANLQHALDPMAGESGLRNALAALPVGETGRDPGRAWLALLRHELERGRSDGAQAVRDAVDTWAEHDDAPETRLYAALANAELQASADRQGPAREAFETARTLAEAGQVPSDMLQVAQAYADWLIRHGDLAGASVVAGRAAGWASRDYDAALLQLKLQHALGHPASWRSALERAQALAGERALPAGLLSAPMRRTAARVDSPRTIAAAIDEVSAAQQ